MAMLEPKKEGAQAAVSKQDKEEVIDKEQQEEVVQEDTELISKVDGLLAETFGDKPADSETEKDDSTPKEEDEKPAEKSDDDDEPTPAEKKEEAKLEAKENSGKEKDKVTEDDKVKEGDKATEEDAHKSDKEIPQLTDAYFRAAIHRGWKPEEINELYKVNPELCTRTLGNIFEAVKRSNEEFALLGRSYKNQKAEQAAAEATPPEKIEYKKVDYSSLEEVDPSALAIIKSMDEQGEKLFNQVQELQQTKPVQNTEQPSGYVETRTQQQEVAVIQQQIENFWKADEIKPYNDFYGELPKDAVTWDDLSPGQRANRWAVIEMMDDMMVGARMNNRDMNIDEAMRLAHLNISEGQRVKVIREEIKADVVKRSKSLSLEPASADRTVTASKPGSDKELEAVTSERLAKVFG
ncbi:hypothetical protein LCGC14_1907180 [marine sediment metagenome]|uniref:Uncharacterized protein n=1 Tax=marine sediment metagenome TaxID=412755 RepID=A0A0F9FUR4_9ZZZZ